MTSQPNKQDTWPKTEHTGTSKRAIKSSILGKIAAAEDYGIDYENLLKKFDTRKID